MFSFAIAILRRSYFVVESEVEIFAPRKSKESINFNSFTIQVEFIPPTC